MPEQGPNEKMYHPPEHPTGLRFSFANRQIGSEDYLIHHPTGVQRVIEYPNYYWHIPLRNKFISRGLILGRLMSEDDRQPMQHFVIPSSSRPLAYDASSHAEGEFSYGDGKLFYEMGNLFATASRIANDRAVLDGDIGHAIAIVEFTKPGDRKLFFAPGAERLFRETEKGIDPIAFYAQHLYEQFADRFPQASLMFRTGYEEARSSFEA